MTYMINGWKEGRNYFFRLGRFTNEEYLEMLQGKTIVHGENEFRLEFENSEDDENTYRLVYTNRNGDQVARLVEGRDVREWTDKLDRMIEAGTCFGYKFTRC